jgi:hypothetical protein
MNKSGDYPTGIVKVKVPPVPCSLLVPGLEAVPCGRKMRESSCCVNPTPESVKDISFIVPLTVLVIFTVPLTGVNLMAIETRFMMMVLIISGSALMVVSEGIWLYSVITIVRAFLLH